MDFRFEIFLLLLINQRHALGGQETFWCSVAYVEKGIIICLCIDRISSLSKYFFCIFFDSSKTLVGETAQELASRMGNYDVVAYMDGLRLSGEDA